MMCNFCTHASNPSGTDATDQKKKAEETNSLKRTLIHFRKCTSSSELMETVGISEIGKNTHTQTQTIQHLLYIDIYVCTNMFVLCTRLCPHLCLLSCCVCDQHLHPLGKRNIKHIQHSISEVFNRGSARGPEVLQGVRQMISSEAFFPLQKIYNVQKTT